MGIRTQQAQQIMKGKKVEEAPEQAPEQEPEQEATEAEGEDNGA